jgi:hypothetical protein
MRILIILFFIVSLQTANAKVIEGSKLLTTDSEIFYYLFEKHFELVNPNCHRKVFEGRSSSTMIAMGCKLYELEVGPLVEGAERRWYKGMYSCDSGNFPFTAKCMLK